MTETVASGAGIAIQEQSRTRLPGRLRATRNPLLYEINTRVWLTMLSRAHGRRLTLTDVPDLALDTIAAHGFDLVWLMGVWTASATGRRIACDHPDLWREYDRALPGWGADDVVGSPYSISAYEVSSELGGRPALAALRRRLAARGIGLILDFVPNHTALDHPWARDHPEYYLQGEAGEETSRPDAFVRVDTRHGPRVLAHGRDPYFPPWSDTLQVNAVDPGLREAHTRTMLDIAQQCDGVRCDMAMLLLADVFANTWGDRATRHLDRPAGGEYWGNLTGATRAEHPAFIFMAEVYWDLESRLLALGFDYAYDKTLYDRLRHGDVPAVDLHLNAQPDFQRRTARFIENHDEERAARVFAGDRLRAAATAAYTLPGLKIFHDGQLEGLRIRLPVQLGRRHLEPPEPWIQAFYEDLLRALADPVLRVGSWHRLKPEPAWEGNPSHGQILAHLWDGAYLGTRLVAINLGDRQAQCRVRLDCGRLGSARIRFRDLIGPDRHVRGRDEAARDGLFLDLDPYRAHIFTVEASP